MRLSKAEVRDILSHYDLGKARSVDWLADGYQSDNYTLVTDWAKYCLRLIYDTEDRVEYVLGVYEFLASRGFPTAEPVRTVAGQLYVLQRGTPVAIQTFVEGISAYDEPKTLPAYGRALGQLHAALAAAPLEGPEDSGCLLSLKRLAESHPLTDPYVVKQYAGLQDELASLPLSTYTRCVVHGDCGPKDFYFEGDRLTGVLDFGAACPDYILYDIATMLMYTATFSKERGAKYESFIGAYCKVFPLPREELLGLHAFLKVRFLIQVYYHWMRYREGIAQGLDSLEENLQGVEDGKAMLRLLERVPQDFYYEKFV